MPRLPREMSKLIRGSGFIFACRLTGGALTLITQILLARWMGATELGIYVLAFSWCVLLANLASVGIPNAAMRFVGYGLANAQPGYIRGFARTGLKIVLSSSLCVVALAMAALYLYESDSLQFAPLSMALFAVPFYAVMTFLVSLAAAHAWYAAGFLPDYVLRPAVFLCAICAAWILGSDLTATAVMQWHWLTITLITIGVAVVVNRAMRQSHGTARTIMDTGTWVRTSAPLLVVGFFNNYFPELTIILVGLLVPSDELAVYAVGFRMALIIRFGLQAIYAYVGPEASALLAKADTQGLQRVVNRSALLGLAGTVAGALILLVLGKQILTIFGPEFMSAYWVMIILSLSQVVQGAVGPVVRLLTISGHEKQCMVVFGTTGLLTAVLILLLVPIYGIIGAAISASTGIVIWSIWFRWLVARNIGVKPEILSSLLP
jgi:O-antigen/teichoic acid export membrane protein